MPSAIDELVKRRVTQQWISGCSRDFIAADNNIGTGTVSSIVNDYKIQLENSDLGSVRELAVEARKHGLSLSDLASIIRLHNYSRQSGANEDDIESFIAKVHDSGIPQEKVIEYVNQLHDVSKEQAIPLNEVSSYIKQKLEEKHKIDQEIKEANAVLENKNVGVDTINEYLKLKEALDQHSISIQDIDKLLTLLNNAKENGFDTKKIVMMFSSIKRL